MALRVPQKSPSPVYRRPKDDPSHPSNFDEHYGTADLPELFVQGTIDPSDTWFVDAMETALEEEHSIIPIIDDDSSGQSKEDTTLVTLATELSLASDTETDSETSDPEQKEQKVEVPVKLLELVPQKNVVQDIEGIFGYIKHLGTGLRTHFLSFCLQLYCTI